MFSSGVCCGNGFWCYEGEFCSTTDPSATADGNVNCCSDAACKNLIGLGLDIIPYSEQPGYTSGVSAATSAGLSSVSNVVPTATGGSTAATSSPASKAASATGASPAATKTSAGELAVKVDLMTGLLLPLLMVGWTGLCAHL